MRLKHRHIIGITLLCGLLGFASCHKESFELPHEEVDDNNIFLTFRTAVAGVSTRTGTAKSSEISDETIKQLLVVIVSEEPNIPEGTEGETEEGATTISKKWVVEHNRLVKGASNGLLLSGGYTFKVKAGCRKRIYLIANYEGLKDVNGKPLDFTNQAFIPQAGKARVDDYVFAISGPDNDTQTGNRSTEVEGYTYNPDLYGIPMTAVYEITIPNREEILDDEYELTDPLYVVRAATKFSFSFTNHSTQRAISVTGFKLEKVIGDKMYLMPHVNKNSAGRYWVVNHPDGDNYTVSQLGDETSEASDRDWINWMVKETKKTGTDPYQWLTDYEVATPSSVVVSHIFASPLAIPKKVGETPFRQEVPNAIYLPESKTLKSTEDGDNLPANLKLQEYNVTIYTQETFSDSNGTETIRNEGASTKEYTSILPRLASLFRNTHVRVNISFNDYTLDWEVDVEPYWGVELDPVFGLDSE